MAIASVDVNIADRRQERWRWRSMLALVILMPVTFYEITSDGIDTLLKSKEIVPHDVSFGAAASYAGGHWRLKEFRVVADVANLPVAAVAVQALFEVTIESSDLAAAWSECSISLQDPNGRKWRPTQARPLPLPPGAMTCGKATISGAKPGDKLMIADSFLVPEQAVSSIRPSVSVYEERPNFLSFAVSPNQARLEPSPAWLGPLRLLY